MKFEDDWQISNQARWMKFFQAVEIKRHESMPEHGISGRITNKSERLDCVRGKGKN